MKTAKILAGVAIGVALIGIGVSVAIYYKQKSDKNEPTAGTRDDLSKIIE